MHQRSKQIVELYCSKQKTRKEICSQFNMTMQNLYKLLKSYGIEIWDITKKQILPEDEEVIIKAYKDGGVDLLKKISKQYFYSERLMIAFLKQKGIYKFKRKIPDRELILKLYKQGIPMKEIAIRVGVRYSNIYSVIKSFQSKNNKYYDIRREKSAYAKMFYEFNK